MDVRAIAQGGDEPRRVRLVALFALLFVAAQILFAAHADDLSDHAPQSCEYCLAAAVADDPNDLVVELAAPLVSYARARQPVAAVLIVEGALRAANPRGPPAC